MNITKLNSDQINAIAGGERRDIKEEMHHAIETFMVENPTFNSMVIEQCINVIKTKYGVNLCVPTRKPLTCPYEVWGMLHDLSEEMPKC